MSYQFAEIFYSLQGEGHRKGTANVFARFAGCNLQCNVAEHGFNCDTDFTKSFALETAYDVFQACRAMDEGSSCVIFTGGEPGLQLDEALVRHFWGEGWHVAVETNGMFKLPGMDWVSCSPKRGVPAEALKVGEVDELRIVIGPRDLLTRPPLRCHHLFVSPAFDPETDAPLPGALARCVGLCLRNPGWRLSVQDHKTWGVR